MTSDTAFIGPAGVLATACRQRETTQHGKPQRWCIQLATRERQAGPCGVAERFVVPEKSGNSDGGKGPQLKENARNNKGPRD